MIRIIIFLVVCCAINLRQIQGKIVYNSLDCRGKIFKNVTLSAYYVDYLNQGQSFDSHGKKLRNLQDYLDGRVDFITLAIDEKLRLPYKTPVCIPELNKHFGRRLTIQVRDNGSNLTGKGFKRADICVRSEADSYNKVVNQIVTLVF